MSPALRDAPRKTRNRTISKRPRILPVSSHVLQRTMAIGRVWFAERSEIPLPDLRASNNGRRSFSGDGGFDRKDRPLETAFHIRNNPRLVSGAKPRTPKGSSRTAQGASPGFKVQIAVSPERAAQGVRSQLQINARHKARLWYRDPLHRPFGASLVYCACSQGLRPGLS